MLSLHGLPLPAEADPEGEQDEPEIQPQGLLAQVEETELTPIIIDASLFSPLTL